MTAKYRRFQPVGQGQKEKRGQHREDPHGIFMLHSDHVDILSEQQDLTRQWRSLADTNDRTILQLRDELKKATSPDREPDWFVLCTVAGVALSVWPTSALAMAAGEVENYRTGDTFIIKPAWGTIE